MKKYNNLNVGIIYFIVHFILEVTCFYILSSYMKTVLDRHSRDGNLKCAFAGGLYLEKVNY